MKNEAGKLHASDWKELPARVLVETSLAVHFLHIIVILYRGAWSVAQTSQSHTTASEIIEMGRENGRSAKGIPNKHLHARVAFLQQAATYLAFQRSALNEPESEPGQRSSITGQEGEVRSRRMDALSRLASDVPAISLDRVSGLSPYLSSQLRQVALKAQIRLEPAVKRSICKTCNTILLEGETCLEFMENLSRNGGKPHAATQVLECRACGAKKRFPLTAKRQKKKGERREKTLNRVAVNREKATTDSA